jgi:hypothetical protein
LLYLGRGRHFERIVKKVLIISVLLSISICFGLPIYAKEEIEIGSTVSYTEYQAEYADTNGDIVVGREKSSEASGRGYVSLSDEGDYITFTLTEPADALVLRYCIPDSHDGFGQEVTLNMYIKERKNTIALTSKYS